MAKMKKGDIFIIISLVIIATFVLTFKTIEIIGQWKDITYGEGYDDLDYLLSLVPDKWEEGIINVTWICAEKDMICQDFTTAGGRYLYYQDPETEEVSNPRITMARKNSKRGMRAAIIHEFAHHVWYTKMDKEFRRQWYRGYLLQNTSVTAYAMTNVQENFAEEMTKYYMDLNNISDGGWYEGEIPEHKIPLIEQVCGKMGCKLDKPLNIE